MRGLLNSMTNNSKNRQEGFKVVIEDRWSGAQFEWWLARF